MDRFSVVPAAYVVLRRDTPSSSAARSEVLLQLRRGTGYMDGHWACGAAGHVEAGESALQAAAREAREELGIEVDPAHLRPLTAMHRTHRTGRAVDERVDFFLECRRWTGTPATREADKSAGLAWYDLAELPDPVVPHELAVLQGLRTGSLPAITTFGFPS